MAIQSFGDRSTQEFFADGRLRKGAKWASVAKIVERKLDILDYAERLDDLRSPPGNRLEALRGEWAGWYSIRVNRQWRVVFRWTNSGPERVRVIDYHR